MTLIPYMIKFKLGNFQISWRIEFFKTNLEKIFKSRIGIDYKDFLAKNISPKIPQQKFLRSFGFLGELNYDFVLRSSITVFTFNSHLKSL